MTRLAIIVRPAVYNGKFSRPVSMDTFKWRSPLQRVRTPWVLGSQLTVLHRIEEIPGKGYLRKSGDNGRPGNKYVYRKPLVHKLKRGKGIVPPWHPINTHKVHRHEYEVSTNKCQPEVKVPQSLIH